MVDEKRVKYLLTYLDCLGRLENVGYKCHREIENAIRALESELIMNRAAAQPKEVEEYVVGPTGNAKLYVNNGNEGYPVNIEGPARILVDKD